MEALCRGLATRGEAWDHCLKAGLAQRLENLFDDFKTEEGMIWLLDPMDHHLVPVFNNGPTPEGLVGAYRQPSDRGIISMVLAVQSAVSEREVYRNPQHDGSADRQTGRITVHMMATPLYFADDSRGVVSVVRLRPAGTDPEMDPAPFEDTDLESLKKATREFGRWLDACLTDFPSKSTDS